MQPAMNPIGGAASPLSNLAAAGGLPASFSRSAQGAPAAPFADLLTDAVGQVNQLEDQARTAVAGLMAGSGVDVHQAMIATQKATWLLNWRWPCATRPSRPTSRCIGMQF